MGCDGLAIRLSEMTMKVPNWTRRVFVFSCLFLGLVTLVAFVFGIGKGFNYWDWFGATSAEQESNSTTLRNMGLLVGGVVAVGIAVWRSRVAERQVDIAQQSLLHDRYQRSTEMLGSGVLAVRLGGIYALQRLAEEYPLQYHVQIMSLFCAFVRNPTGSNDGNLKLENFSGDPPHPYTIVGEDIQAVMLAIGARGKQQLAIEKGAKYRLDLHGSDLRGARLNGTNLASAPRTTWPEISTVEYLTLSKGTDLTYAKLCSAHLDYADLQGASLTGACLCKVGLEETNLSNADLADVSMEEALINGGPVLTGAEFSYNGLRPARGIRQNELTFCTADPNNPPKLNGVRDQETGEEVFWRGLPSQATNP